MLDDLVERGAVHGYELGTQHDCQMSQRPGDPERNDGYRYVFRTSRPNVCRLFVGITNSKGDMVACIIIDDSGE